MSQAVGLLATIGKTEIGGKRRGRPPKGPNPTPLRSSAVTIGRGGKRGRKPSSPLRKAVLEILAAGGKMKTKDIVSKIATGHPGIARKYKNLYLNVNQILVSAAKKVGRGTWKSA